MSEAVSSPNAQQIDYWNAEVAEKWKRFQKSLDAQVGPLGEKAMDRLALTGGESVLDIGCGCGQTSRQLAGRVGRDGAVTAIDISEPMLAVAAHDAAQAGLENVTFRQADAQIYPFPAASFDAAFSRFGVMFFADPVAAFANVVAALKPRSGRLAFVCWREFSQNPWMARPVEAAMRYLPPPPPPEPNAPGPFAFADGEHVRHLLMDAGFVDITLEPYDEAVDLGPLGEAVTRSLSVGPLGRLLEEHPRARADVTEALRETLSAFETEGHVRMQAAVWIVSARRP
jgi:ubiquinone/menaquinone biosynthesis C-methylase UbiE